MILPPENIYSCLQTFFVIVVVTTQDASGMLLNKHPAMHRTAPTTGGPKRSILPRNGVLG